MRWTSARRNVSPAAADPSSRRTSRSPPPGSRMKTETSKAFQVALSLRTLTPYWNVPPWGGT
jgi:hypothetical protein